MTLELPKYFCPECKSQLQRLVLFEMCSSTEINNNITIYCTDHNNFLNLNNKMDIVGYNIHNEGYLAKSYVNGSYTYLFKYDNEKYGWKTVLMLDLFIPINSQDDLLKIVQRLVKLIPFS